MVIGIIGGAVMAHKTVRDIMAMNPIALSCNEYLDLAKDIMTLGRIRHFPVVDGGKLVGVVSQRDLYRASLGSVMGYGERTQDEFLRTIVVKEIMSHPPVTIPPDAPIKDAAHLMIDRKIGCLPVMEAGKLVGLITETDLLKELLEK